jgi:peptidyl-prolyl cis-trans isomerase C
MRTTSVLPELLTTWHQAAIDQAYERWLADNPPKDEVRARHILVEEEEAAQALIAELDEGADFAALAEEHSLDPSAEGRGGDLGYFTRERMVAPFA